MMRFGDKEIAKERFYAAKKPINIWDVNVDNIVIWPGRFFGIVGNDGNHGRDGKFHKSDQIAKQTKRNINKLCLGKISIQKTLRIKFCLDSGFSNELYGKKRKPENTGNPQKAF